MKATAMIIGVPLLAVSLLAAGLTYAATSYHGTPLARDLVPSWSYPASASAPTSYARARNIPVLTYHQLNNGVDPDKPVANLRGSAENEIMTERQLYDEMAWLHSQGYHTISSQQYVKWATHQRVALPRKPVLLTSDDGIVNMFEAATPVLKHFGYTMVAMIVSGFAEGSQKGVRPYVHWNASWDILRSLDPAVWSFAFHAGAQGHEGYGGKPYFYPYQLRTESAAHYEARVLNDVQYGLAEMQTELGKRFNPAIWAVPFNDLAQSDFPRAQPTSGKDPSRFLPTFASRTFKVVFVDGLNKGYHEHYRYEVHGTDTLQQFQAAFRQMIADGSAR